MTADTAKSMTPFSIIVCDGHYDKVHYALSMAAAAAVTNRPTTLFFTLDACRALMNGGGSPPGWARMPTTTGETACEMDTRFQAAGIATFEELLESCLALGVAIMVCETGLKARGFDPDALREDIPIMPGGLVTFLSDPARDGQLVFV